MSWLERYQLFLLDFDGLLVDTERLHFEAYRRICSRRGFDLDWSFQQYCLVAHLGSDHLRSALMEKFPDLFRQEPRWEKLYGEKSRAYLSLVTEEGVTLRPGAEELLEALAHHGAQRAVVTNSSRAQVEALQELLPALRTVGSWITREQYHAPKPSPDCYLTALNRFGVDASEAIGFEDTPRGVGALLGAGIQPVLVSTVPYAGREELAARGTILLELLTEALPFVQR